MIGQNQKIYCICDKCAKTNLCNYYKKTIQTIKDYIDTPLNIHFPNCKNYKSILEDIPMHVPKDIDKISEGDAKKIFIKALL